MHALLLLSRLKARGAMRIWLRAFRTPEGAIRAAFTLGFILLLFVPLISFLLQPQEKPPEEVRALTLFALNNFYPLMMAMIVLGLFFMPFENLSLRFSTSEIEFLFSAPFSRRELLIYKLLGVLTSTLVICLGINCFITPAYLFVDSYFVVSFIRGYVAILFSILFLRLIYVWAGLIRKSVTIRILRPIRIGISIVVSILTLIALISAREHLNLEIFSDEAELIATTRAIVDSVAFQYSVMPFRIFSNMVVSDSFGATILWGSCCAGAIGLVVWLIMNTDEDFLERELRQSQRRIEVIKSQRSMKSTLGPARQASDSLPMLPFLGGIGPLAWRQLLTFFRIKWALIFSWAFYMLLYLIFVMTAKEANSTQVRFGMGAAFLSMITLVSAMSMPMGFHTDIKNMDMFKSLPFSKWHIAAGQLAGPLSMMIAVQYTCIVVFMWWSLDQYVFWLTSVAFAPLVSIVILGIINVVSLLYPRRPDDGVVKELENIGHILVFMFLLIVAGGAVVAALLGAGGLAWILTQSIPVTVVACWLVMLFASFAGVWLTGWAFDRFDVAKHR